MKNTIYKGYEITWGITGTSVSCKALHKFGVYGYTSERKVINHIERLIKQGKIAERS